MGCARLTAGAAGGRGELLVDLVRAQCFVCLSTWVFPTLLQELGFPEKSSWRPVSQSRGWAGGRARLS